MTRGATSRKFLGEVGLAGLSAALALLTAVWPDWIEEVFGFDPDHHSGEAEWLIVAALAAVAVIGAVLARNEWRRLQTT
jgi:hypothetical protein